MLEILPTCVHCGATMGSEETSCPRCGAAQPGRSLMLAPVSWRQVAGPAAAGLALAAASVGLALVRRLVEQRVVGQAQGAPARSEVERSDALPRPGPARLVRRRFWAVGDGRGLRAWGLEETTWQRPDEGN